MKTVSRKRRHPRITTGDVARMFNTGPKTVTKWADEGWLAHHRIPTISGKGGDRRFRPADLIHFAQKYGLPIPRELRKEPNDVLDTRHLLTAAELEQIATQLWGWAAWLRENQPTLGTLAVWLEEKARTLRERAAAMKGWGQ